ncbi:MAG: S-layer protein [Methanoregula sp.]|nr:S-layer protein [Methanoregula sp.]
MTSTSFSGNTRTALAMIALIICSAVIAAPVSAAIYTQISGSPATTSKYLGGSPSLSASVTGANEFAPGQDATITVLVKNSGVNAMKQLNQTAIEYSDLPTTAKFVTLTLTSDNNAVIIKSDPQILNNIPASGTGSTVQFKAKISSNATAGEYQLPLIINYQYPRIIQQEKDSEFEDTYTTAEVTLPVTIRIKPEVKIAVVESTSDTISAGTEGYLSLKIRNDGPENGTKASVKLVRSGSSAIIPTDGSAFIGDFPSGGIVGCRFKMVASKDATTQTYPVDVLVTYTNSEGDVVTTKSETIGIPVDSKTSFAVISPVPAVAAGSQGSIEVQYRNTGNTTVYETQSRLTPHGDVTIDNNVAYLGELKPGESATALYDIAVGKGTEPSTYTFDSKLRFRDALGNSQESDTVAVTIQVLPARADTIAGIPTTVIIAGIILVVIAAGIGLFAYRRKKSPQ